MNFSINGYGENTATFRTTGLVCTGHTVKMADNLIVSPCEAGDEFIGIAVNTKDGYAGIQLEGYVKTDFSGTAPSVGFCGLAADGKGGVTVDSDGRKYLVVEVDTVNNKAGFIH